MTGHRSQISPILEGTPRPLWSIMIPTYNCAHYLRETLQSILAQDFGSASPQIEVVDDCSTKDDPEAVVREVGQGRVGFYRQPGNGGHTRNFETCLERSRGILVHLLHGDDAVRPGFYAAMGGAFAARPEIGAAFCRHIFINGDGLWLELPQALRTSAGVLENLPELLAVEQRIQTPSMVVRRATYEDLGGFDRSLSWAEDWEMWARIATSYKVWYDPAPLALYRVHSTSNSSGHSKSGETMRDLDRLFTILAGYIGSPKGKKLTNRGRYKYASGALRRVAALVRAGEYRWAWNLLRGAVRLCPSPKLGAPLLMLLARIARSAILPGKPSSVALQS